MALKTKRTMQTPLTAAKGMGSTRSGTDHWLAQHVAEVALIPLVLFVLVSFVMTVVFGDGSFETAHAWVKTPWNGIALILMIGTGFYHGAGGMQSGIVEDYIHHTGWNLFGMIAIKFLGVSLALIGILAVLKVMLSGA